MENGNGRIKSAIIARKTPLVGFLAGVTGVALGAGLMYVLDPDRGRRRRDLIRRKVSDTVATAEDKLIESKEAISDRAQKLLHDAKSAVSAIV
jgi:hypothetical protein